MSSSEKFTSELVFKLLEEVEKRPCVWKKSDAKYKNKYVKSAAFEEIGVEMGAPADVVKEKLRSLRTIFLQNNKKNLKSGSGAAHYPKWEFYNAMLFMTGEATTAGSTDSLCSDGFLEGDDPQNLNQLESTQPSSSLSAIRNPDVPKTTSKRKRGADDLSAALNPLYEELSKSRERIDKAKGPNEKFAMEVAIVLNNIRQGKLVQRAKAHIQLILAEAMTESAKQDLAETELYSSTPSPIAEPNQFYLGTQVPVPTHHQMAQQDAQRDQHNSQESQDVFSQNSVHYK